MAGFQQQSYTLHRNASHLYELKILLMQNSQIQEIEVYYFNTFSMLEYLNLANNCIKNLPGDIFMELILLKLLNLSNNKIEFTS